MHQWQSYMKTQDGSKIYVKLAIPVTCQLMQMLNVEKYRLLQQTVR